MAQTWEIQSMDKVGDQYRKCSECKMEYEIMDGEVIYDEEVIEVWNGNTVTYFIEP